MDCVSFTTSEQRFSSKTVVLASDGFGTLQSLTCSTYCAGFSVEDRSTGRSRQPKEPVLVFLELFEEKMT